MPNVLKEAADTLGWSIERVAATAAISVDEASLIFTRPHIDPADLQAGTLGLLKRAFELRDIAFVDDDTQIEAPWHENRLKRLVLSPDEIVDLKRLAQAPPSGLQLPPGANPRRYLEGLQRKGLIQLGHVVKLVCFDGDEVRVPQPMETHARLSRVGRALWAMWSGDAPAAPPSMLYDDLVSWWLNWRLTVPEVAVLLGCSPRKVIGWRHSGVPESVRNFVTMFNAAPSETQNEMLRKAWAAGRKGLKA
jgi:hypothetical protein